MRVLGDRLASFAIAVLTAFVTFVPAWFLFVDIRAGDTPAWVYVPLGGLVWCGLVLTFAFGRKAVRGIAPSRQRRRS